MTPRSLILGLDASPKRIGWALVTFDEGEHVAHGLLHVVGEDDLRARREAFREIARSADARGDVCAVVIEDAYVGVSRRGTILHAISVGNVEAWAATRWPQQLVVRTSAASWRKAVGLPTRGKEPVMEWATQALGAVSQDEADAYGIAVAGNRFVTDAAQVGNRTSGAVSNVTELT